MTDFLQKGRVCKKKLNTVWLHYTDYERKMVVLPYFFQADYSIGKGFTVCSREANCVVWANKD